jgi:hypothetical protein
MCDLQPRNGEKDDRALSLFSESASCTDFPATPTEQKLRLKKVQPVLQHLPDDDRPTSWSMNLCLPWRKNASAFLWRQYTCMPPVLLPALLLINHCSSLLAVHGKNVARKESSFRSAVRGAGGTRTTCTSPECHQWFIVNHVA